MSQSRIKRLVALLLCVSLILGAAAWAENTDGSGYSALYFNNTGTAVWRMQDRLRVLGYFEGEPTGGYYQVTAAAVAAFQEAAGLSVNGREASAEMLALLFSDSAPAPDGNVFQPTPEPTAEPEGIMKYGMRDSDGVRQVQKRLKELGYFHNSLTGNFFGETKAAIEAFQEAVGLTVNGNVIDEATQEALFSETAPGLNDSAEPTAATALPTATPRPESTENLDATQYKTIPYGDTGTDVWRMQDRLRTLGFFDATPTGGYYNVTRKAIEEFQAAAGLTVDGTKADGMTLAMLYSDSAPTKVDKEEKIVDLYFGTSGSTAVRRMQDRLKELGYFNDVSTGGYYRMTAAAVEAFQKAAGLTVNANLATVEMQEKLYSSDAPAYGSPAATATPAPSVEPTAEAEDDDQPEATNAPADSAEYRTLTYAMSNNDDVRLLQAKLNELGYLSVAPTGGYWSMTVSAMRAFLKDNGMSGDGKTATPEMQAVLFSKDGPEYSADASSYKTLQYGVYSSSAVRAMQTRLRALGYFNESSTGNYYSITAAAVEAFQKAAGLTVNGKTATPEMQALLFSSKAPAYGTTVQPDGEDESGELPEVSQNYTKLVYGTQGSDKVRDMQNKLKERGFFSVNATGGYWKETAKAVAAFQAYCGLTVNGNEASSEMLGLLFYEGDLDAYLAQNNQGTGSANSNQYANAKTNAMLSKGMSGEQVDLLILRLTELGYLDECEPSSFDSDVYDAVKWFQSTNSLDVDGIAGPKTLTCLYGSSALDADESKKETETGVPPEVDGEEISVSIGEVKNIDFFSDEGVSYYDRSSGVFKDGATAIVTDIATGISFQVRRTGGYSHADVAPATAFDTWQLYRIYNYEWSWTRHAVYVTLENGETLAGSINGMPHGNSTENANNFDGHMCLHFLNSRTHGSDKVDPDHQAAISQAAGN